jgi:hypothetical protein
MKDKLKSPLVHLNLEEARALKAQVFDMSELSAKQALYGIIQVYSLKVNMSGSMFLNLIDDSVKYSEAVKRR